MKITWNTAIRWVLAALLAWAGTAKVMNPNAFAESIMGFRLVPWPVAVGLAHYLPWLELVTALGLVVRRWQAGAVIITTVLFTGFSVVWAITWARGIDATCGCFGGASSSTTTWSFARAAVLAAFAWMLLLSKRRWADSEG